MKQLKINGMPSEQATAYRNGALDANGMTPEHYYSDGSGIPCRHCLKNVAKGDAYLALAYRPFPEPQPYAETGPIFLHADNCEAYSNHNAIPLLTLQGEPRIVRGYNEQNRIVYGTGKIVEPDQIMQYAQTAFDNPQVSYIHVRSSENNCYTFRIDRIQ